MRRRNLLVAALAVVAASTLYLPFRAVTFRSAAAPIPDAGREIPRLAEAMRWTAGITIADIGAGDGSYSFAAAKILGASGRVYATEIDSAKLNTLRETILERKLTNIVVVEGAADDTKLPSECCDAIFIRHVYHHITVPETFDKNLLRSLKTGGRLAIIDFPPENGLAPVEGVPANRGGHGIPRKIMTDELTAAGFRMEKTIEHWSGNDYCVIFVKPAS